MEKLLKERMNEKYQIVDNELNNENNKNKMKILKICLYLALS